MKPPQDLLVEAMLLQDIKVLDIASFLAGPGAATLMADHGARVIKVEPPGGDGYRRLHGQWRTDYNWQLTSRHKRSISLDLRLEQGREVLMRLLEDADVLITNFRNDQLQKYRLDYETLHERFPRLVFARLTGYGDRGPDRLRKGYDATAWFARSGILQLTSTGGAAPAFPPGGVGDHATAMSLFAGVMMALYKRAREGAGSLVETSLVAGGCWANGMQLQGVISGFDLGLFLEKSSRSPFADVYRTRDGRHVVLVFTNPAQEWPAFARALGREEWLDDARFADIRSLMRNRDEARALFAEAIGARNTGELCLALDEYRLPFSVVEGLTDVVQDAHLVENDIVIRTESDDPDFAWTINSPIRLSGQALRPVGDPPACGEHTEAILREHGYTDAETDALVAGKVVFTAEPS